MQSDIVQEARLDAKAFRENAVYTGDGQRVKLGANADRLDAYASHMDAQAAEITRLTEALRAADEREKGLRDALAWYGEQARLARFITSEGDAGRHALQDDGGKRARAALKGPSHDQ